ERRTDPRIVEGPGVPVRGEGRDRPRGDLGRAERVEDDDRDRQVDEREDDPGGDAQGGPHGTRHLHQIASKAPRRRATTRNTSMIVTGTIAYAAANGWFPATPTLS